MDHLELIAALSDAFGPSGFEDDAVAVMRKFAPENLTAEEDSLLNLYLRRKTRSEGKPVVMLDAHTDEVGFMVQAIRPNGTLKFIPLGGWVAGNIPAHKVLVKARGGNLVPGIVASKPPHFMSEAERNRMPAVEEMSIDIGAAGLEDAKEGFGIRIGAPVAPDVRFTYDEAHDLMVGKAFDNRLGCAAILSVFDAIGDDELNVEVVGAAAAQEEVGTRGAAVTARRVKPDIAVVFEGSPADDTVTDPWLSQTALHKGPMLRHIDTRMITNPRYQRWALDLAEELGVPVQEAVRSGGSTDGAPIHLSGEGIPCIVIGFPVRYCHSHYGIASFADFRAGVKLAEAIVRRLDADVIAGF